MLSSPRSPRPRDRRAHGLYVLALPLLLFPVAASAAPGPGDFTDVIDLSQDMMVPPADAAPIVNDGDPAEYATDVIFLNYDGGQLTKSNNYDDDATTNTSWICGGNFPAWGDNPSKKQSILQAFHKDWEAYEVAIVTERPGSGHYTMAMIGPGGSLCGTGGAGVAPVDCNNQEPDSVVYSYTSANSNFSANGEATIYSQEVAHSYGLEHVNDSSDIMNPSANGSDQSFHDKCTSINGSVICGSQHSANCGTSSQQNAHQELLDILGPSTPDMAPPTVTITYPTDGEQFAEGASFDIQVTANDDKAVQEIQLYIDGADSGDRDYDEPWGWGVDGIPAGVYEFQVIALDVSGNQGASDTVTITVTQGGGSGGDPTAGGTTGGDPTTTSSGTGGDSGGDDSGGGTTGASGGASGGGDSGGGDSGGGDSGDDTGAFTTGATGALPPGFGGDPVEPSGCACTSGTPDPLGLAFLPLWVLAAARRRR